VMERPDSALFMPGRFGETEASLYEDPIRSQWPRLPVFLGFHSYHTQLVLPVWGVGQVISLEIIEPSKHKHHSVFDHFILPPLLSCS